MNLLRYEFVDGPEGSINGMLRKLVKELRYYRSEVSIDEFNQAIPSLKAIEATLQQLDSAVGEPRRDYLQEIMEELNEESENEANLKEDIQAATKAIVETVLKSSLEFDDLLYTIGKSRHYHWLQFLGYTDQNRVDGNIIIARAVFQSICNKYNYIFIDLSV